MPVIEISDLNLPELAPYIGLTQAQLRSRQTPENGLLIAESEKVITAALDAGFEPVSMLMERRKLEPLAGLLARCPQIPVYTGERELLAGLTGYALTRGVLCAMKRKPTGGLEVILDGAERVAVLEGIVDTTNMGAIFRNAAALGMDAVLLTRDCCDPLSRRALRVSMGTVFKVPWAYVDEQPGKGLAWLKEKGFSLAALALREDSVSIDDPALRSESRLAVLLGTEGDGLRQETIDLCDYTVMIPMSHGVDSLNVAAAGALAFWELGKNRRI